MLDPQDYRRLDAGAIAKGVAGGRLRPTEIVEAALDRAAEIDRDLHAFTVIEHEAALAAAQRLETALAAGQPPGLLAGVPVAVKDLILTKGLRTTFGSKLYEHFVPDKDDIAVERLRAAGAILLGKTNVSEFGYGGVGHNPVFPTTRNPFDRRLTSGGSSAGSAVAVATGVCPVALGSDGGGSIRLPAAFNGLYGIKASMGRVPLWPGCRDATMPGVSGWESIEHIGPLARSVADAALVLSVIAGPDPRDRHSIPDCDIDWCRAARPPTRRLRIAYCADWGGLPLDPEIRNTCDSAMAALATDFGHEVEITGPPFPFDIEMFRAIIAMETDLEGLRRAVEEAGVPVSRGLAALLGRPWRAGEFTDANVRRKAAVDAMARFMAAFDLLATPTTSCLPFAIDLDGPGTIDSQPVEDDAWTPTAFPANLTGQPAASIPIGFSERGLPIGLQMIGRHLDDRTVLEISTQLETWR